MALCKQMERFEAFVHTQPLTRETRSFGDLLEIRRITTSPRSWRKVTLLQKLKLSKAQILIFCNFKAPLKNSASALRPLYHLHHYCFNLALGSWHRCIYNFKGSLIRFFTENFKFSKQTVKMRGECLQQNLQKSWLENFCNILGVEGSCESFSEKTLFSECIS